MIENNWINHIFVHGLRSITQIRPDTLITAGRSSAFLCPSGQPVCHFCSWKWGPRITLSSTIYTYSKAHGKTIYCPQPCRYETRGSSESDEYWRDSSWLDSSWLDSLYLADWLVIRITYYYIDLLIACPYMVNGPSSAVWKGLNRLMRPIFSLSLLEFFLSIVCSRSSIIIIIIIIKKLLEKLPYSKYNTALLSSSHQCKLHVPFCYISIYDMPLSLCMTSPTTLDLQSSSLQCAAASSPLQRLVVPHLFVFSSALPANQSGIVPPSSYHPSIHPPTPPVVLSFSAFQPSTLSVAILWPTEYSALSRSPKSLRSHSDST